jgi:membrane protein
VVTTVLFGMSFEILSDVQIQWAGVCRGAFDHGGAVRDRQVLADLTHVAPASTYGAAGSWVLLLLGVYYSSLILFFGTCLTTSTILVRGGKVIPKKTAVRASVVLEEAEGPEPVAIRRVSLTTTWRTARPRQPQLIEVRESCTERHY